jgi:hypothetical protein
MLGEDASHRVRISSNPLGVVGFSRHSLHYYPFRAKSREKKEGKLPFTTRRMEKQINENKS